MAQHIVTPPQDQVVKVGGTALLNCSVSPLQTGNWFQWVARTLGNLNDVAGNLLFQYPARQTGEPTYPDRHGIEGTYSLQINNVTLNDAGWYQCQLNLWKNLANLIVVGKGSKTVASTCSCTYKN